MTKPRQDGLTLLLLGSVLFLWLGTAMENASPTRCSTSKPSSTARDV